MTNERVRALIEKLENGDVLSFEEQMSLCKDLLRANNRLIEARKLGYATGTAANATKSPSWAKGS